jgi:di/tricarboxylate transporter
MVDGRRSLSPQEAFSGFGSVAVIMVTAMFVFSAALVRTGAAEMIGGRLFRACAHDELLFQIAVLSLAAVCSMFINETTIVLVFMPVILAVCKERNLSPSRYLLCAAYGAALGGQWTLIGTRSNIIVSEFLRQRTGQGIGFFDFSPVAVTVFLGCATYFFLIGRRFMPKAEVQSLEQELGKEYLTEVMVTPQSATVGLTLDQLDWAKRQDVTIVGVIRDGERMPPNGWMKLHPGDALIMQGAVPTIGHLLKSADFAFMEEVRIGEKTLRSLDLITVEALLSPTSRYTGRTMQQTNFGRDYGFTVLGISRHGQTIHERPSATRLEYGDSLLLLGHNSNLERLERNPNLIVLSQRDFPNLSQKTSCHHDAAPGRHYLGCNHWRFAACSLHSVSGGRGVVAGISKTDGHLQIRRLASRCYCRRHDLFRARVGENGRCGSFGARHCYKFSMGRREFDSWRLAPIHGCAHPINRKCGHGDRSCADCLPGRTRGSRGSQAVHDRPGNLYFHVVLHTCCP